MARVVVIGGGVAGLSAGITAALGGHEVTVLEKCANAGGNLVGWNREGYHIDNCVHWLTGTNPKTRLYKTWQTLGVLGQLDVYQPKTLYTVEADGKSLSLYSSLEKTEEAMLAVSESDDVEIRSFIRAVRAMNVISGTEKLSFKSISHFLSLAKYFNLTARELSERFRSPVLKSFTGSFFGEAFGAIALINVFSTFTSGNGALPRGGSTAMAEAMTQRLAECGGVLLTKAEVAHLEIEGHRVRSVSTSDGRIIECDYTLFACDPAVTARLLPVPLPDTLRKRYETLPRFSSYHFAYALEGTTLPFSSDIILDIPKKYAPLLQSEKIMLREFSHEPSFSKVGKTVLGAMLFVDERGAESFIKMRKNNPERYRRHKEKLGRIVEKIITQSLEELSGRLTLIDSWTPATYERYLGSECGAYMSFILPAGYMPKRLNSKIKGLSNAYLASQWQNLPGGLPVAAECGIHAAKQIKRTKQRQTQKRKATEG
ncbi:MAG: NAD(P)/FAD-dependent oxidoreductase [Clostridia bacterium]|nr:NAD(P)/FAD-dependent oxidoreductase [Clostridia bacterium]